MKKPPINSLASLPSQGRDDGLKRALGQVVAKGRDTPSGLYPLTTRHDVEHQVGYVGPDTGLWSITGGLTEQQNTGITDSRSVTWPSTGAVVSAGHIPLVPQSGRPSRVGKYDWAYEARNANLAMMRPKDRAAPYVRSGLDDASIRLALDYNVRGNMCLNEWNRTLPHVYEQGNGYALAGPAYISSNVNVDTF
jgi:hypothetical protein